MGRFGNTFTPFVVCKHPLLGGADIRKHGSQKHWGGSYAERKYKAASIVNDLAEEYYSVQECDARKAR